MIPHGAWAISCISTLSNSSHGFAKRRGCHGPLIRDAARSISEGVMTDKPKADKPKVSTKKEHAKKRTYLLKVSDEWYRMRRMDLASLFLEGYLPTPLLQAVDRFQDVRRTLQGDAGLADSLSQISVEDRKAFLELMRRVACAAVKSPPLTLDKDAADQSETLIFVEDVDLQDLLIIWRSVLGEAGVVTMSDDQADEFRPDELQHDGPAVSHGEDLRTETIVMDSDAGDSEDAPRPERVGVYH